MVDLRTIFVTWMDGEISHYDDATASVREGVLHVHVYKHGMPVDEWHFPASNIRAWGPRPWTSNHGPQLC